MAEFVSAAPQTVAAGQNVLFSDTPVRSGPGIIHRDGSGIVSLRNCGQRCKALFKVTFGANIAVPAAGTVEPISLALSIDGEPLASATAIVTPAAAEDLSNVFVAVFVGVTKCCCVSVAVENTSAQPITVQNANLIVERVD